MAYNFGKALAKKGPAPAMGPGMMDDEEAEGEPAEMGMMEPAEEEDEDVQGAVEASAFADFAKAAGFKNTPEAYAAFKDAVKACLKG